MALPDLETFLRSQSEVTRRVMLRWAWTPDDKPAFKPIDSQSEAPRSPLTPENLSR